MLTNGALRRDEEAWIEDNQERCAVCGHLQIFHQLTLDLFNEEGADCQVDDCECHI